MVLKCLPKYYIFLTNNVPNLCFLCIIFFFCSVVRLHGWAFSFSEHDSTEKLPSRFV